MYLHRCWRAVFNWLSVAQRERTGDSNMAGDEVRQRKGGGRKKPKKGKGKGQGGLDRTGSLDGQNDLLLPPPTIPPKKPVEDRTKTAQAKIEDESAVSICLQVLFPYLLAGMGMVMAGMVLDSVQVRDFWRTLCNTL